MKCALCVMGFSCGMEVERLEIHCPPGFAIFPGHWFTHWYWLKDTLVRHRGQDQSSHRFARGVVQELVQAWHWRLP